MFIGGQDEIWGRYFSMLFGHLICIVYVICGAGIHISNCSFAFNLVLFIDCVGFVDLDVCIIVNSVD